MCVCFFFIAGHCESFTADFHWQLSRKFTCVTFRWCAKATLLNELSMSQINVFPLLFPLSLKKPQNPPLPWFLSCKSTLTLATDIPRWEFPFVQQRFWDSQDIIMQFVPIIRTLSQFYIPTEVPCSWTRVETTRLVCIFSLLLLPLSSHQVLKLELKEIREQQDLLFRYMNFLKQEGAVHVLQFCLAVGERVPRLLKIPLK